MNRDIKVFRIVQELDGGYLRCRPAIVRFGLNKRVRRRRIFPGRFGRSPSSLMGSVVRTAVTTIREEACRAWGLCCPNDGVPLPPIANKRKNTAEKFA